MPDPSPRSPEFVPPVPEQPLVQPEVRIEEPALRREQERGEVSIPAPVQPLPSVNPQPVEFTATSDAVRKRIESVLADGLEETYARLDPATQARFKQAGEVTATNIERLLQSSKVKVKKIVDLIVAWLRIIPGVNKFFLEQEAKIKADKVLGLRRPPQ